MNVQVVQEHAERVVPNWSQGLLLAKHRIYLRLRHGASAQELDAE